MANPEEPFMLSSEIDNGFNDNYNIWTMENQTEASDELCKCVCAENADCISENYIDTMCKSDGSQAQDYSVGLKVGMAKSDVEDAVNPDHDIRLTISSPMEGSKLASKGETTEAGFVNLRDSLSGAIFSTWELEADHSMYVLASTLEVENHSQRVDNLIEHKDVEKNQFHPLVQKICQDVLSPTLGTNGQCSDDILTGNFKGESSPGNKCMLIIKPQIVGSDVGDTDNYQTLVEGEYADPAGGEIDGANDMKRKMVFVQESTSNNNFLSNCTAKDEPVTTGDLVEQLGNHLDLQDCSVLNDLSIDKGEHVQDGNSFHESHEKYFDSNPCDSELAMHIIPRGAEPDPSGGPDIVDGEAEKHDAQNTHDGKGSHLSNKLEVGDSPHMIDEKIIEPPTAAHDKETYPLSEAIHSESIGSYVEADPPLEQYNFNIQLHYHSKSTSHPATLGEGTLQEERCKDNHKPNGLLIKSPTYDLPFSDDWLATSEAGLEILTLKSGAVQHSPPDKTTPCAFQMKKRKKRHVTIVVIPITIVVHGKALYNI
ncbi:hypothetical protein SAY86_026182 [Trapa natans]|uniref:Uncharacterized protein n=1 Tax=Trapa natans TaxID=22666 RepID=A0AAN7QEB7_TRANT|nr:hypothetical protein SAY86_026182 [Trapa natans]